MDKDLNNAEACYRAAGNIAEISDILIGMGNIRRLQNRYLLVRMKVIGVDGRGYILFPFADKYFPLFQV